MNLGDTRLPLMFEEIATLVDKKNSTTQIDKTIRLLLKQVWRVMSIAFLV